MDYTGVDAIMDDEKDTSNGLLVKTALGIFGTLVVAALLWVGTTLNALSVQVAVLQSNFTNTVSNLQIGINEAKASAADRYTASAAASDFHSRDARIDQSATKIDALDNRLRTLEIDVLQRRK